LIDSAWCCCGSYESDVLSAAVYGVNGLAVVSEVDLDAYFFWHGTNCGWVLLAVRPRSFAFRHLTRWLLGSFLSLNATEISGVEQIDVTGDDGNEKF
jgi:hypothetical protein